MASNYISSDISFQEHQAGGLVGGRPVMYVLRKHKA